MERLKTAPQTIRALYIEQGVHASEVVRAAKEAGRKFISVPKDEFSRMSKGANTQGILAEVEKFHYAPLDELLQASQPRPCLFLLDRVTDPQNLGNILRTLACLGGIALVLPQHESADLNETVLRIACGAENYIRVSRVTNLVAACQLAKKAGYWIAGAVVEKGTPIQTLKWPMPLAVVIGSEGSGIRPGLTKHLDLTLTLPMPGAAISFNVATAAALIAYEITCRRLTAHQKQKGSDPLV